MLPLLELAGVVKDYRGLRPLRIRALAVAPGQAVALTGLDAAAAETFTNLVTGATLPDEGEVRMAGQLTSSIADENAWLAFLDQFGVVSERVVLLEAFTVRQNVAIPLTLELQPMDPVVAEAVSGLADEVGIAADRLDLPVGAVDAAVKQRVRLARAIAHAPKLLILEHATVGLDEPGVEAFARDLNRALHGRALAAVVITADARFARSIAPRTLALRAATGELRETGRWRPWR